MKISKSNGRIIKSMDLIDDTDIPKGGVNQADFDRYECRTCHTRI